MLTESRYYQKYYPKIDRWVKIDSRTGLIISVKKTPDKYENLPDKPPVTIKKTKSFWDLY